MSRNESSAVHEAKDGSPAAACSAAGPVAVASSKGELKSSDAAWLDMRLRFSRGEHPQAEDYLPGEPRSATDEMVLDLLYAEYVLRRELGEEPAVEEFAGRFPHLAALIRRLFDFHDQFDEVLDSVDRGHWPSAPSRFPDSDASNAFGIPQQFGKYTILAPLDTGGQADVFRAVHPELARQVVLKVSRRSMADDGAAGRLIDEGRTLADLDHPNIARVYDLGIHDGLPYLVMDFIRGGSLHRYAKDHELGPRESARIVAQVARGVAAAHRLQIAHLDIKPKNILMDEQCVPRLIDFGLCRLPDVWVEKSAPATLSGTLPFMPPEQADELGEGAGLRSDIFALGGVLFYLLTGQPPYPGPPSHEMLERVKQGAWSRELLAGRHTPTALRNICMHAMAANPAQRFDTADDLAASLESYEHRFSRRRLLIGGASGLAAAVAGVLIARDGDVVPVLDPPTLSARVWQGGKFAALADLLPLVSGDQVQVQAQIPAGVYASLFALSADGKLDLLAEWPASEVRQIVQFPPEDGGTAPLTGPRGTEMLILCCDPGHAPSLDNLREIKELVAPLPVIPKHAIGRLSPEVVHIENSSKGFGPSVSHEDPEGRLRTRLAQIQIRLKQHFPAFQCLAFPHQ